MTALDVATGQQEVATFITADQRLARIIQGISAFQVFLTPLYLPQQ
jgi:hypothetical protein